MRPKDIVKGELIGLSIEVTAAKNPTLVGLRGQIIDETKYTLTIEDGHISKKVLKEQVSITTTIHNKIVTVDGRALIARPEERIKKKIRR